MTRDYLSLAAFAVALSALVGCSSTRSDSTQTRRDLHQFKKTTAEALATGADGAISVVPLVTVEETWVEERSSTETKGEAKTGPDMQQIAQGVRVVSQAAAGGLAGPGTLAVVASLGVSAVAWAMKNGGAVKALKDSLTKAETDRDEGWQKAEQHQARAEQYARELPPTTYVPRPSQPRV